MAKRQCALAASLVSASSRIRPSGITFTATVCEVPNESIAVPRKTLPYAPLPSCLLWTMKCVGFGASDDEGAADDGLRTGSDATADDGLWAGWRSGAGVGAGLSWYALLYAVPCCSLTRVAVDTSVHRASRWCWRLCHSARASASARLRREKPSAREMRIP